MGISKYLAGLRAHVGTGLILRPGVSALVRDDDGRLLLEHRADSGDWSLPGGAVDPSEAPAQALVREVREETGLDVEVIGAAIGGVELLIPFGGVAAVVDFVCRPAADADLDAVRPGDDAADVGWFTPAEVRLLDCSSGLVDTLDDWGFLRRS